MAFKDIYDAHSFADVYTWLRLGLMPLLFKSSRSWSELPSGADEWPSENVPHNQVGVYLNYNRVVGGLLLKQLRADPGACKHTELSDSFRVSCTPYPEDLTLDYRFQPE